MSKTRIQPDDTKELNRGRKINTDNPLVRSRNQFKLSRMTYYPLARRFFNVMDGGGNGGALPLNNKQRNMLPNKSRGEFARNPRKDSEVSEQMVILIGLNISIKVIEPFLYR